MKTSSKTKTKVKADVIILHESPRSMMARLLTQHPEAHYDTILSMFRRTALRRKDREAILDIIVSEWAAATVISIRRETKRDDDKPKPSAVDKEAEVVKLVKHVEVVLALRMKLANGQRFMDASPAYLKTYGGANVKVAVWLEKGKFASLAAAGIKTPEKLKALMKKLKIKAAA